MIFIVLLIYLILMCCFFKVWLKYNCYISIRSINDLIFNIIIVIAFFIFFVFFLRVLNLFRDSGSIDLNKKWSNYDLTLVFLVLCLMFLFRGIVFYLVKLSWFRLHYYMLSHNTINVNIIYQKLYIKLIYKPMLYSYRKLKYLNWILTIIFVFVLFRDIFILNGTLSFSLIYLKYYSIFKLIYYCSKFIYQKQNLLYDLYIHHFLYPGNIDEEKFFITYNKDIAAKSLEYKEKIILEF